MIVFKKLLKIDYRLTESCKESAERTHVHFSQFPPVFTLIQLWYKLTLICCLYIVLCDFITCGDLCNHHWDPLVVSYTCSFPLCFPPSVSPDNKSSLLHVYNFVT